MQAKKNMIFSISGWRTIISQSENPFDIADYNLCTIYYGIRSYIEMKQRELNIPDIDICIGCDSRPSGIVLLELAKICLEEHNCSYDNLGLIPIPTLLAYAKEYADGFIYFSASHNPKEYNGVKFGSDDGKVQGRDDHNAMMSIFEKYAQQETEIPPQVIKLTQNISTFSTSIEEMLVDVEEYFIAYQEYKKLIIKSVFKGISNPEHEFNIRLNAYTKKHGHSLGVLLDPNGGARTWQGDMTILKDFGIESVSINTTPSKYQHAIIPEGESLEQARNKLIALNTSQKECFYPMAVVCDCDGDRGNAIFISPNAMKSDNHSTRELEAQEVFAIILDIELAWAKYTANDEVEKQPLAFVVNGPSSLRCNYIAKKYCAHLVRGEVGEANIVSCGEELRAKGYNVPLVGEASNGGIIMFPSSVRDPLCTILSLFKAILWSEELGFEDNILSIVESLPCASTSTTEAPLAKFSLPNLPYEKICALILNNFYSHKDKFISLLKKADINVNNYKFFNFVGTKEIHIKKNISLEHNITSGGLAIHFFQKDIPCAFVWLRPSGTEPVVRLIVDIIDIEKKGKSQNILVELQELWRKYLETVLFS